MLALAQECNDCYGQSDSEKSDPPLVFKVLKSSDKSQFIADAHSLETRSPSDLGLDFDENRPTLIHRLQQHAALFPARIAYRFLPDGESVGTELTFGQLNERTLRVAAALLARWKKGSRILILHPTGPEFYISFLGCLQAGMVAVPAYPPRPHRTETDPNFRRIAGIVRDCQPAAALTSEKIFTRIYPLLSGIEGSIEWILSEQIEQTNHADLPAPSAADIALLQYTSGSTGNPKGVLLSHRNLMENQRMTAAQAGDDANSIVSGWLPAFHDMGLMGLHLHPLYLGIETNYMPPAAFLQKPVRWLRAISRFRATTTAAPPFALRLCLERIQERDLEGLDLSSWEQAFIGAEPIPPQLLVRFNDRFASFGLRETVLYPCFGLAESTLFVSGGFRHEKFKVSRFDQALLEQHVAREIPGDAKGQEFVSCGRAAIDTDLRIVSNEGAVLPEGRVGEIWLCSPAVASGYWDGNNTNFQATLTGHSGRYLRTGDLGFISKGELFIAGRMKDLIIINGRNVHPQDIEESLYRAHERIVPGRAIAFAHSTDQSTESLVVVLEVDRHYSADEGESIVQAVRNAIARDHDLNAGGVGLVRYGSLPLTTSGKVRRSEMQRLYSGADYRPLLQWTPKTTRSSGAPPEEEKPSATMIEAWLCAQIAERVQTPIANLDPEKSLAALGVDSVDAVDIVTQLGEWLGRDIPAELPFEYPTIRAIAQHLAQSSIAETIEQDPIERKLEVPIAPSREGKHIRKEDLAILGVACRFPGAEEGAESYWRLLCRGESAISQASQDRHPSWQLLPDHLRKAGFIHDISRFDATLFGISPREASAMDPQQRLLLETTFQAFEDAAYDPRDFQGERVGVFVGICGSEYGHLQLQNPDAIDAYTHTGHALSIAANRISYTFGFHGPSVAVDTACSSSLYALHLARQSLLTGECDMAVVAGVNLLLLGTTMIGFDKLGVISPRARCMPFSRHSDGIVRGEGCGAIVLKRAIDLRADDIQPWALLVHSATNQDGRSFGLTAPNPRLQRELLHRAYSDSSIDPRSLGYIEAHGTGTALGDPIEFASLQETLRSKSHNVAEHSRVHIGSVKSVIGHLEAAAGIAGLIKICLLLDRRKIISNLDANSLTEKVDWKNASIQAQNGTVEWESVPGRAGINGFGFGGANAHAILEESARLSYRPDSSGGPELFVISAADRSSLEANAARLAREFDFAPVGLQTICRSAARRSRHGSNRLAVVSSTVRELSGALRSFAEGKVHQSSFSNEPSEHAGAKIAFVFPGQGPRWWPMYGRLEGEPEYEATILAFENYFREQAGWTLREEIQRAELSSNLVKAEYVQPIQCALQCALARTWINRGITPSVVLGHSLGEIAAAFISGILTFEDTAQLALLRGKIMSGAVGLGSMAMAEGDAVELQLELAPYQESIWIAAQNSLNTFLLAGSTDALEAFGKQRKGSYFRILEAVNIPGHGRLMEPFGAALSARLTINVGRGDIPFMSSVRGDYTRRLDAAYWGENLSSKVQFFAAMQRIISEQIETFVEMNPVPALNGSIVRCLANQKKAGLVVAGAGQGNDSRRIFLESYGRLYAAGIPADVRRLFSNGRLVRLPSRIFASTRFWRGAGSHAENSLSESFAESEPEHRVPHPNPGMSNPNGLEGVRTSLVSFIAAILHTSPGRINVLQPLREQGFDSLMAVELKLKISSKLGVELPGEMPVSTKNVELLCQEIDALRNRDRGQDYSEEQREDQPGPVALTPAQAWFFEHSLPEINHWNVGFQVEAPEELDPEIMEEALQWMRSACSVLRTRFIFRDGKTTALLPAKGSRNRILQIRTASAESGDTQIEESLVDLSRRMDIESDTLQAAWLQIPGKRPILQILLHHLICDGFGLRLFGERLREVYAALEERKLPGAGGGLSGRSSAVAYARHLESLRQQKDLLATVSTFEQILGQTSTAIPFDRPDALPLEGSFQKVTRTFSRNQSDWLCREGPRRFGCDTHTLLLALLGEACSAWTSTPRLCVELETSGRNQAGGEFDLSRMIGWVNTIFPFAFNTGASTRETVQSIQKTMARLSEGGAEFGDLRLATDPALQARYIALPEPLVKFMYFGNLYEQIARSLQPFAMTPEQPRMFGANNLARHSLYAYFHLSDGRIVLQLSYASSRFDALTIDQLASHVLAVLEQE